MVASEQAKTLQTLTVQVPVEIAQDFLGHCQRQEIEVSRAISFLMELLNEAEGDFEFLEDAVDGLYAQLAIQERENSAPEPWETVKAELGL
jgi:hypothetical protein